MADKDIFEKGTRSKVRFGTNQGQLSIEDAWDLSLDSLDTIAQRVNKAINDAGQQSFIPNKKTSTATVKLTLQLDILKHIIGVKVAEKEVATNRAARRVELERLQALVMEKEMAEFAAQSKDEIAKRIEALQAEDAAEAAN